MSAILRERGSKNENLQIERTEKVSKIPSYRVIWLKLMMEWKLLEQRVACTEVHFLFCAEQKTKKEKKSASSSTQILD